MAKLKLLSFGAGIISLLGLLCGCDEPSVAQKRPYGEMRLGKLSDISRAPESMFDNQGFLVRFDEGGFSAMSTLSSWDLTPLVIRQTPDGPIFVSTDPYSKSTYDKSGKVLTGPAKDPLPFYQLTVGSGVYCRTEESCPKDTLFVIVGREVPSTWRLKIP